MSRDEAMEVLAAMGHQLRTQDGMDSRQGPEHATSWPVYQVEQKVRIFGVNPMDVDPDGYEQDEEGDQRPYIERYELVQGAVSLTRSGIEGYLAINGHNLREPRIYVGSMHRVLAMKDLIKALCALGGES
jgi:hypothetical protein